jgi:hypothetical protein
MTWSHSEWNCFSLNCFSENWFSSARKCWIDYLSVLKSWHILVGLRVFSLPKSWRYPWRPCSWNPQKKICGWHRKNGAPHSSSWTVHDLVIRSWPAHEQDHQIIKKNDISWSSSWSREPVHDLLMNWFTNARVRDFRALDFFSLPQKFNPKILIIPGSKLLSIHYFVPLLSVADFE